MIPIRRKSRNGNEWGHYKYTPSNFTWISILLGNPSITSYQFPHLFPNPLPHFTSDLCKQVQKEKVIGGMRSFFNFLFPLPLEELSTYIFPPTLREMSSVFISSYTWTRLSHSAGPQILYIYWKK